jgi:hypothetical protein
MCNWVVTVSDKFIGKRKSAVLPKLYEVRYTANDSESNLPKLRIEKFNRKNRYSSALLRSALLHYANFRTAALIADDNRHPLFSPQPLQ